MKKILHNDFSQQRRKEKSLLLLPLDVSKVIWHSKIWGLCLSRSVQEAITKVCFKSFVTYNLGQNIFEQVKK